MGALAFTCQGDSDRSPGGTGTLDVVDDGGRVVPVVDDVDDVDDVLDDPPLEVVEEEFDGAVLDTPGAVASGPSSGATGASARNHPDTSSRRWPPASCRRVTSPVVLTGASTRLAMV